MTKKTAINKTGPKTGFTLANKITVVRILMIPFIVIALLKQAYPLFYFLFLFSMATDFFDGMVARMRGEQTMVGAFLDPMADKLLLTSVYLTLTVLNLVDVWIFVVIFSRDLLIVLGWSIIYILTRSFAVTPRMLGKVTTSTQMAAAALFTIDNLNPAFHKGMIGAVIALTVVSIIDYIMIGEKRLGQWE